MKKPKTQRKSYNLKRAIDTGHDFFNELVKRKFRHWEFILVAETIKIHAIAKFVKNYPDDDKKS